MNRRVVLLLATAFGLCAQPNFGVSHYTRLDLSVNGVDVAYVLELREVPTFTMLRDWKLGAKSSQSALEQKAAEQAQEWAKGLEFRAAGKLVEPRFVSADIRIRDMPDGQHVARIASTFKLLGAHSPLQFEDHNYPDRYGWKEIVIASRPGVQIITASHDSTDLTSGLTSVPDSPNASHQDLRAFVDWRTSTSPAVPPRIAPIPQPDRVQFSSDEKPAPPPLVPAKPDFLSHLLAMSQIPLQWVLLGLVVAFGLGGAHALEPGHGKTIVAAYLVGSRGTMKHAALLGAVVTFTHTISVFLLGLAMLVLSKSIVPGNVIKTLEIASGVSIVAIGAMLFYQRLRDLRHPHPHSHLPDQQEDGEVTLGSLIALGVSGGLVPCPAALVIMLGAIAFGHTGLGLVLLLAFSLGLAGVLMVVGMFVLYAKRWLPDSDATGRHPILRPLLRVAPVLSALVIVCVGLLLLRVQIAR